MAEAKSPVMEDLSKAPTATATKKKVVKLTPKKKAAAKKVTAAKKVEKPDLIQQVAHEVENLTKEKALAEGRNVQADNDYNNFKIGGILSVVRAHGWYSDYDTFQQYIEQEFPTLSARPYRKARYLMEIYDKLVESKVKWTDVESLGWTKLSVISGVLTPDNVKEWATKAKKLTVLQLQGHIKELNAVAKGEGKESTEPDPKTLTTMTFKVHPDQKENIKGALEKARQEYSTEFDSVALDHLAMGYLTGKLGKVKKVTLASLMKKTGPEEVMAEFAKVFPHLNVVVTEEVEQLDASDETVEVAAEAEALVGAATAESAPFENGETEQDVVFEEDL